MEASARSAKEARRKLRKATKRLSKGELQTTTVLTARDLAMYAGAHPSFELSKSKRQKVHCDMEELQSALLYAFSLAPTPQWLTCRNRALLSNVAVIIVRGGGSLRSWIVSQSRGGDGGLFGSGGRGGGGGGGGGAAARGPAPPAPTAFFSHAAWIGTKMPRGVWHSELHEVLPVDRALLALDCGRRPASSVQKAAPPPVNLAALTARVADACLSRAELLANGFPLTATAADGRALLMTRTAERDLAAAAAAGGGGGGAGGSAAAASADTAAHAPVLAPLLPPRLLALDCEMCTTVLGGQLARLTVTDESDATLLDIIVKPELPVLDHLTRFSGIDAGMLARATVSFDEARASLARLLDGEGESDARGAASGAPGASASAATGARAPHVPVILVGHSLENDLGALRLVHSRVIDTSILYPHGSGLPLRNSLRSLARAHLGREIQAGHGAAGHDSVEDAVAAMHLAQRLLFGGAVGRAAAARRDALLPPGAAGHTSAAAAAAATASGEASESSEDEEEVAAEAPPPAKRRRHSDGDGSAHGRAAPAPAAASFAAPVDAFTVMFCGAARPERMPRERPLDAGVPAGGDERERGVGQLFARLSGAASSCEPAAVGSGGAAIEAAKEAPPAASPAAAASPPGGSRRGARSLLCRPDFTNAAVCAGASVVGSASFVASLVAGSSAAGVAASDAPRVLEALGRETRRIVEGRRAGEILGMGLLVAELAMPRLAGSGGSGGGGRGGAADWPALERLLGSLDSALAPGTGVFVVCQGDLDGADGCSSADVHALQSAGPAVAPYLSVLSAANSALYGVSFFYATRKLARAPEAASDPL